MHAVDDMAIFIRVVDRRSLSAAGRELRLSTAVVSSRLARLEERMGVRLLHRTTRQVSPTEEGRVYYEHCLRMTAQIEELEHALADLKHKPTGALKISLPVAMGRKYIAPLIPTFTERNPDIQVRAQLTDRIADLIEEDVDVAIRKGALQPSTLIARRLVPDLRVVCGAPAYFDRRGVPETPADLRNHNCLLLRFPGSRRFAWTLDGIPGGASRLRVTGTLDSDSSDVLIDWAVAGHGIIMKSVWDIADHLETGALVGVLRDYWPADLAVHAVMPPRREQPTKTRSFIQFLIEELQASPVLRFTDRNAIPLAATGRSAPQARRRRSLVAGIGEQGAQRRRKPAA